MTRADIRMAALACLSLVLAACSSGSPQSETAEQGWAGAQVEASGSDAVESGKRIAAAQCAGCHAIDASSSSPRADAPPLRDVLATYDTDNLAYRFIEGMKVGHDGMPLFDFDVRSADDLLAFIASISGS